MIDARADSEAGRRFCRGPSRALWAGILFIVLNAMLGHGSVAAGALAASTAAGSTSPVAALPRRVLALYSGDRLLPANVVFDASLRQTLASSAGAPIDCSSEFLDEVHFPMRCLERMRDFLRAKYGDRPPDVLVAIAPPGLDFCLRVRSQLFPSVPIVFAAMGTETPTGPELGPRITGVRSSFDGAATLRLALRLHPRTQQVFIVSGSAGLDSTAIAARWSGFREADFATTFHHLTGVPRTQLVETLANLPDNSLVISMSMFGNGPGDVALPPQEIEERIAHRSRAPIYAAFDPLAGSGLVGAVTTPMDAIGRQTAEMVVQVLGRAAGDELPAVQTLAATPIFDWNELQRWGIRKNQLPPGSIVRFEPPSFWRQHFLLVITVSGLFLLQSALILALVLQSRRRRRAEQEALRRRQELEHMTRVATVGELTASLAHEINQPLAAILSNAQAAQRLLAAGDVDLEEFREILADIAADDQRAGEVIRRMRALLRKGGSDPTTLDVNDLVDEVIGLVRGEMILQNVPLGLDLASDPLWVHGDRIQLQQVLLNLIVNALDAMKETAGGARRVVVRTKALDARSVQVAVQDFGSGVPVDKREQIFEPFVTTKPHGMGLGLAICRSIILAHGGRIGTVENGPRGATFWFTLPSAEEMKP